MPRLLSTLLVVALLGGTAAAFAVTQGLKIEPSPILAPRDRQGLLADVRLRDPRRGDPVQAAQAGPRPARDRRRRRQGRADARLRQAAAARHGHATPGTAATTPGSFVPRGRLQAARPPDRPAPDDRPAERDAGRHDRAEGPARARSTPQRVLARRRRPRRPRRRRATGRTSRRTRSCSSTASGSSSRAGSSQRSASTWNGKLDGKPLAPGVYRLQLAAEDRPATSRRR